MRGSNSGALGGLPAPEAPSSIEASRNAVRACTVERDDIMKSIISRIALTLGCSMFMALGVAACGNAPPSGNEDVETGKFAMPLTTSTNGHTYRLQGQIDVWGPTSTSLVTSNDPGETYLSATLPTGSYNAYLWSWSLERADAMGVFAPVPSTLLNNVVTFNIYDNSTTTVSYRFETDGNAVVVGSGGLRVTIGVTELPPVCTPLGSDCPSGSWCPPMGLTGQSLACVAAGTIAVGSACQAPSDCVANATCVAAGATTECAALCAAADIGAPCASGGTCQAAGTAYGICRP
jgi:hypothetical protein